MTKRQRIKLVKDLKLPVTLIAYPSQDRYDPYDTIPVVWHLSYEPDKDQFVAQANPRLYWQVATPEQLRERRDLIAEIEESQEFYFRKSLKESRFL